VKRNPLWRKFIGDEPREASFQTSVSSPGDTRSCQQELQKNRRDNPEPLARSQIQSWCTQLDFEPTGVVGVFPDVRYGWGLRESGSSHLGAQH
jgi:hypothetical protein